MEFEKRVVDLDVNDVLPNRFQPRIKFNEDSINELCESIKEHGVIQPIVVRAMGDKYEIIAGERRYKASLLAGKPTIPAVITELNDKDSAEVALIENVQRKDLTPIEEAISYKKILDMGYLTQEELATKLGKTQSTVANKLRLLNLDEEVQEAVLEEKISERHARSLLKLSNMSDQRKMLNKIVENRLTVRKTDEEIGQLLGDSDSTDVESEKKEKVFAPTYSVEDEQIENPFKILPIVPEKVPTFDSTNIIENNSFIEEPIIIIDDPEQLPAINEDQVTVNPTEDFNPFKLEDNVTNVESNLMQDNIPSNPIEDIQPADVQNDIKDNEIIVPTELNPGFMDIEKITEVAKDIPTAVEKQPIDINSLLKPSVIGQEETTNVDVPEEKNEEELRVGKFFTLPTDEEKNIEENDKTADKNAATGITEMFNFNLDGDNNTNSFNNQTTPVDVVEQMDTIPNISTVPSIFNEVPVSNVNEINLPIETMQKEEASNTDLLESVMEPSLFPEVPVETLSTEPIIPEVPVETLSTEPIISEAPVETLSTEPIFPEVPVEAISTEAVIPQVADEDLTNNLINPNFDFNISAPVEREELVVTNPISSEDMPVPPVSTPAQLNKNISNALEIIRNSTKELEKMGYIVDTEEFDFETAYQVIIKIEK